MNHFIKHYIEIYIKYYFYLFIILCSIPLTIFFSPSIGLGSDESFILYQIFGIFRSKSFLISILFLFFSFLIFFYIRSIPRISQVDLKNIDFNKIISLFFIFLLFVIGCFNLLIDGYNYGFSVFKAYEFSNFPAIVNKVYHGVLQYDFYTNTIIKTPKIISSILLSIPSLIGIDWYMGVFLFEVIIRTLYLPLLFLCYKNIIVKFIFINSSDINKSIFIDLIIFFVLASNLLVSLQTQHTLLGWRSIFVNVTVTTAHCSLIIGLIYILITFSEKPIKIILAPILLFVCTLTHILVGLAVFFISLIYDFSSFKIHFHKQILVDLLCGIVLPIIVLLFLYENNNPISAQRFIDIYILDSHWWHYKISAIIGKEYFLWIVIYLLMCFISFYKQESNLIRLSLLSLAFMIIPAIIQFLTTEVWKIKSFAVLGINRLTAFNTFIFCLNSIIIFGKLELFNRLVNFNQNFFLYIKKEKIFKILWFEKIIDNIGRLSIKFIFSKPRSVTVIIITIILIIWKLNEHNPINPSLTTLCNFINESTKDNTIVITDSIYPSFAIRCFGHRGSFVDGIFPFHDSSLNEWQERLWYQKNIKNLSIKDLHQLYSKYLVTHILLSHKNNIYKGFKYVYKNKKFVLYDIKNIIKNYNNNSNFNIIP
tara:strand:+ start:514 stop:2463 length:1950 start_codon:yes stop_codon:yes gene_type:complete